MTDTRRDLIKKTILGASGLGLRAMATGLPIGFLARPLAAGAEVLACVDQAKAQYLVLSASGAGDPLNANAPGTYDFPDIVHADDPRMAPAALDLGGKTWKAARVWTTLPAWVRARTSFFHHATYTNSHGNLGKVLKLMGATAKQEMLPSIFAKALAPCFRTVQVEPISAGAGDFLTIDSRSLPNLAPSGLRDVLTQPKTPLANLQKLRDEAMDEIHAILKAEGTREQRQYLDRLATSRAQARSLGSDIVDMLSSIKSDGPDGQIIAAVALIRMNVAPVIAIRLDFGADNHNDPDLLKNEAPRHETAVAQIGQLWETLKSVGLEDRVTFAACNVFGRTLKKNGTKGRDHWGSHHTTLMIGKNVRPGVVGGLEPQRQDYYATPIDSRTGAAAPRGGDIPFDETLQAIGKTLGAAVGLSRELLDGNVPGGKVVASAIA